MFDNREVRIRDRRIRAALTVVAVVLAGSGLAVGFSTPADAAGVPTDPWAVTALGSIANVAVNALGLGSLSAVDVSTSTADTNSRSDPRTSGLSQNVGAVGAGIPLVSRGISAGGSSGSGGTATDSIVGANLPPLLSLGAITTTDAAHWTTDSACVLATQLSTSSTAIDSIAVGPGLGPNGSALLSTGQGASGGSTVLSQTTGQNSGLNYGTTAASTGSITGVQALGGQSNGGATIDVLGTSTLTAVAPGSGTGSSNYSPSTVRVNGVTLSPGQSLTVSGGGNSVTVRMNRPVTSLSGTSVRASASVLTVTVTLLSGVTSTVDLLPLSSVATTPTGGIDCPAPPAAPAITAPGDNTFTQSTSPVISGTSPGSASVSVYDSVSGTAALIGTTTATSTGNWSLGPTALAQGLHVLTATQTTPTGTSAASPIVHVTVDTVAPAAPILSTPADGSVTSDPRPPVTGTAEAGSTVTVYLDGAQAGTAGADATTGSFTFAPAALADGPHRAYVTARDAAGNTSVASATNRFTIDTVAPSAPRVTAPANGSVTGSRTPTLSGTADAGTTVRVTVTPTTAGGTPAQTVVTTASAGGSWSTAVPAGTSLNDGGYSVSAVSVDAAGNVSAVSNTNTFTVDGTAPNAPVVRMPANLSTVTTSTPTFSGTAEADSTVTVYVGTVQADAVAVGSVPADHAGAWSTVSPTALADGQHVVFARATDAAGNTSAPSNVVAFTIDTTAPGAPVVQTPADGSLTNTATPTLSGTTEAGSTVDVYVDGTRVGTVAPTGTSWSLTQPTALADGSHRVWATARDAAGNVSVRFTTNVFTVDTTPPPAPVTTTPADGSATSSRTPALGGSTVSATSVTVYLDGSPHSAAVSGTGWSYTPGTALPDGSHTVYATATDAAGNVSGPSNTNTFTVDTVAPAAPVITAPLTGSTTRDTTPAITGTAEAGSTVTVTLDSGTLVTSASGSGLWSVSPLVPLSNGTHTASAVATDAAGNTGGPSNSTTFRVDSTAPAPTVTTPADGSTVTTRAPSYGGSASGNATVDVYVDGTRIATAVASGGAWSAPQPAGAPLTDGPHSVQAVGANGVSSASTTFTVDATPPPAPVIAVPAEGASVNTHWPTIGGTAEPNSTVTVTVDAVTPITGSTTARADGTWSLSSLYLSDGPHSAVATARDAAGNSDPAAVSNLRSFTVDTVAPVAPTLSTPADGALLNTHTPSYSGSAERGSTVTVKLGSTAVGTTTASSADGSWTLSSPGYVADGMYSATATATDAAGNVSTGSAAHRFTIDTTAPAPPVISAPAEGAVVANARPAITGTAEANASVAVSVDGSSIATTTADGFGAWSITPAADLAQGIRTATATATDAAGNTGTASAPRRFTVDTVAPVPPTIDTPANGTITNDPRPAFTGHAENGSTVSVVLTRGSGTPFVLGTATASSTGGGWALPSPVALTDGGYTVTAYATDAAGNRGSDSAANSFTVDTAAPSVAITDPVDGSAVAATRPPISGTADAGAQVTVTLDGTILGTVTASTPTSGPGTWSIGPASDLAQGSHTASAVATDAAGNSSTVASSTFTVDTVAPAAPVIADPADGSTTSRTRPPISGTAERGSTVAVMLDTVSLGTTVADATTGAWSLATASTLLDGSHTATATATDRAGNASAASTSTFTVDTVAPAAPLITAPADGAYVVTATPTIQGSAERGSSVLVAIDGAPLGTVTASTTDGTWSIVSTHLADGPHHVSATATDAAGNSSVAVTHAFTVDTVAPSKPTITTPTPNAQLNTHFPRFAGAGDPGTTITVRIDGTTDVAATTVGTNGTWTVSATVQVADGAHSAVATSSDAAGNGTPSDPDPFTVDTTAPASPAIDYPITGSTITDTTPTIIGRAEAGSVVAVSVDGTGVGSAVASSAGAWSVDVTTPLSSATHTATATATDAAGNRSPAAASTFTVDPAAGAAPVVTAPANESSTNRTTPPVSGTGILGAVVTVFIDGTPAGSGPVGSDGTWAIVSALTLGPGEHVITATQTVGVGPTSASSDPVRFTVDTTPPAAPTVTQPVANALTNDPYPEFSGTAEPGSTVDVVVDGTSVGTTTATSTGHFALRSLVRLANGLRRVSARATDAAGNTSATGTSVPFTIDTTAPAAPVITYPAPNSTTTSTTPTIRGTGDSGSRIAVSANGRVLGVTYVAPDGTWAFTVPSPLPPAVYDVTATATDPAGNVSPLSIDLTITIAGAARLQATGLDDGLLTGLFCASLLLLLGGGALVSRSRRRMQRTRAGR